MPKMKPHVAGKSKKKFDCVEMKRRGAAAISRRLAGMSAAQELKYWRDRDAEFMAARRRAEA